MNLLFNEQSDLRVLVARSKSCLKWLTLKLGDLCSYDDSQWPHIETLILRNFVPIFSFGKLKIRKKRIKVHLHKFDITNWIINGM